jgi:hypothetical protein
MAGRFEYEITKHSFEEFKEFAFFCTDQGSCSLDQVPVDQFRILKDLMNHQGKNGWELVQILFGDGGVVAFWKKAL